MTLECHNNVVNLDDYRKQLAMLAYIEEASECEVGDGPESLLRDYHLTIYPQLYFGPAIAPLLDIFTAEQSPSLPAQPEDHPVRAAAQVLDWFELQP